MDSGCQFLTKNIIPEASKIVMKKGKGVVLWDNNGKDYIDFSAQTLNLSLGQCYPDFTNTIIKQLNNYTFLSS
ncbi:aminotransferase class III-fold pyridoxal phosphate-dependent enzyme [Patescibacteria group bacterium]|nr:aminotransferase class III-fold pyridoxal phosphate-dependent enzyme [Patescibacteria group bacterium]MBU4580733.1 aminotransferase class III-fold pyridoxal phosphate-dependent enzyme [Patescibacteria group bacterium]